MRNRGFISRTDEVSKNISFICTTARKKWSSHRIIVAAGSPMARNSLDVESMTPSVGFGKSTVFVYRESPAHQLRRSVDPGIFENIALSSSRKMRAFGTILPFPTSTSGSNFPLPSRAVSMDA